METDYGKASKEAGLSIVIQNIGESLVYLGSLHRALWNGGGHDFSGVQPIGV